MMQRNKLRICRLQYVPHSIIPSRFGYIFDFSSSLCCKLILFSNTVLPKETNDKMKQNTHLHVSIFPSRFRYAFSFRFCFPLPCAACVSLDFIVPVRRGKLISSESTRKLNRSLDTCIPQYFPSKRFHFVGEFNFLTRTSSIYLE